jgi:polyferredoxin
MKLRLLGIAILALCLWACAATAQFRFPMPEFESGYQHPETSAPLPARIPAGVDIAVLTAAMGLTAWSVLKRRSRREVLLITAFSLVYFGFYRKGCVCPVGSVQNVVSAFVDRSAGVPLVIAAFFFLPLVFALYFGRVFCASVCPLGAVQEAAAIFPIQLPRPIDSVLALLPYAYLGLTVLSMVMGTGYIICRYDPFVGFFRQGATFNMLLTGGVFLLIGLFIARPYCRFLCPYGVLLRWASLFSKWHATITPAECIECRLCETACPYGAIVIPTPDERPADRRTGIKKLGVLLLAAPVIIALAALTGVAAHELIARMHPAVQLAERVAAEERGEFAEHSLESEAFRAGKQPVTELYAEAIALKHQFKYAAAWFGGFMGLVVCGKLIRLSVIRKNTDYEADRGACLSCARCFDYCPVEKKNKNHE